MRERYSLAFTVDFPSFAFPSLSRLGLRLAWFGAQFNRFGVGRAFAWRGVESFGVVLRTLDYGWRNARQG